MDRGLIAGHTASLAGLHSLTADVEFSAPAGVLVVGSGNQVERRDTSAQTAKFWKSGDRIRIDEAQSLMGRRTLQIHLRDRQTTLSVPTSKQEGQG